MSSSRKFNRAWTRFLVFVMTSIVAFGALPSVAQTTIGQKISDPAYFTPESGLWTELSNSNPAPPTYQPVGIAIANVINGPNYVGTSDYQTSISAAKAAGITVLGYVNTGYFGTTTPAQATRLGYTDSVSWTSQIEHDINAWFSFYGSSGLSGIFLDQAQNVCGTNNSYVNLYSDILNFVKRNYPGAVVATNAGSPVPQCYQNAADILVTFEGLYDCYAQDSLCATNAWYQGLSWSPVDPHKQMHLVYNASQTELANASTLSKGRLAGYIYVTPDIAPNPWDTLPSAIGTGTYWSAELADAPPGGTVDTTPPTTPSNLATSSVGPISATLKWTKSTDSGSGVVAYDVYQGGVWVVAVPAASSPSVTVANLKASTPYIFDVTARDGAGNVSMPSHTLNVTTTAANGTITAPGSPSASGVGYTNATLTWTASTTNKGSIANYDIYLNGTTLFATVHGNVTSVVLTGLDLAGTPPLPFTIKARDSGGDVSAASTTVDITPTALPAAGALANESGTYTSTTLTYNATYYLPFALRHVFIDSDDNASTGFQIPWTAPAMGVDYMIENGTLNQYAGAGTDWTWIPVGTVTPTVNGYAVTWQVPVSDLTNAATTQLVLFEGDGFEPTAYPYPYPNPPVVPVTLTKQP